METYGSGQALTKSEGVHGTSGLNQSQHRMATVQIAGVISREISDSALRLIKFNRKLRILFKRLTHECLMWGSRLVNMKTTACLSPGSLYVSQGVPAVSAKGDLALRFLDFVSVWVCPLIE